MLTCVVVIWSCSQSRSSPESRKDDCAVLSLLCSSASASSNGYDSMTLAWKLSLRCSVKALSRQLRTPSHRQTSSTGSMVASANKVSLSSKVVVMLFSSAYPGSHVSVLQSRMQQGRAHLCFSQQPQHLQRLFELGHFVVESLPSLQRTGFHEPVLAVDERAGMRNPIIRARAGLSHRSISWSESSAGPASSSDPPRWPSMSSMNGAFGICSSVRANEVERS